MDNILVFLFSFFSLFLLKFCLGFLFFFFLIARFFKFYSCREFWSYMSWYFYRFASFRLCCMNRIFDISPPFPVIWAYATRIEIGLPISNILFKSWHLIVISFFMLSSSLDRNLLPKAFLNLKKVFSTNSLLPYLFLFLQA